MRLPRIAELRQFDTHRLIPSRYSEPDESALSELATKDLLLDDLIEIERATSDRLLAENRLLPGIGVDELLFGISYYRIVNAAFCHAQPLGSRFNGPERGVWYAAFALETAQAEVAFHKTVELAEVNWFDETVTYNDYLADLTAALHDLRGDPEFAGCLNPASYAASQTLARELLEAGSLGVVYPSVRDPSGTCVACFRPAIVSHVRRGVTVEFSWRGTPNPTARIIR